MPLTKRLTEKSFDQRPGCCMIVRPTECASHHVIIGHESFVAPFALVVRETFFGGVVQPSSRNNTRQDDNGKKGEDTHRDAVKSEQDGTRA